MPFYPSDPITKLSHTKAIVRPLLKLGVRTIGDLLNHIPYRYDDFSIIQTIREVRPKTDAVVRARVLKIENVRAWRKRMTITKAFLEDASGKIPAVWFNQPYLADNLKQGKEYLFSGKASLGKDGLYFSNPKYEREENNGDAEDASQEKLLAVYPLTKGITSRWIRFLIRSVFRQGFEAQEFLEKGVIERNALSDISEALHEIHMPSSEGAEAKARKRFLFEKVFLFQIKIITEKLKLLRNKSFPVPTHGETIEQFIQALPYFLTDSQKRAATAIALDLAREVPMNRLLNGDVGSGKTVVAILSTILAVQAGYQVALMAPTEVLALQHFKEFVDRAKHFKEIRIGLITSGGMKAFRSKAKNGKEFLREIENGAIDIVIGTHALMYDRVKFKNLALVVIDEQHRFGVEQRAKLKNKSAREGRIPHFLSLTATPIPRTLALTMYGDLDISVLDELPSGRKKILTKVIDPANRKKVYEFMREHIHKGQQAYVICPRIESKEESFIDNEYELKTVKNEHEALQKIFPELKIKMLHGKMPAKGGSASGGKSTKEQIMREFVDGKIDILVATSLVEVGIDVPNATTIVIEGAETFGLAQLHQLRGRVGRGEHQSFCFLFTSRKGLMNSKRLASLVAAKNGFELAEEDLKIRGPGDFIGKRQSGETEELFRDSLFDLKLIEAAHREAASLLRADPNLKNHPLLVEKLKNKNLLVHWE